MIAGCLLTTIASLFVIGGNSVNPSLADCLVLGAEDEETILVVLDQSESFSGRKFTGDDFPEIGDCEVEDITSCLYEDETLTALKKEAIVNKEEFARILKINVRKGVAEEAIEKLAKRGEVISAEFVRDDATLFSAPDDYYYSSQWAPSHIGLEEAWSINTGSTSVKVGIIDKGIDGTHPDLGLAIDSELSKAFDPQLDPLLPNHRHGTHVAGIVGAVGDNGTGVAGVCWNVSLVSLRADSFASLSENSLSPAHVVSAITYAASVGIPILNYSGGSSQQLFALTQAISNYNGLLVCAAGNHNSNMDSGNSAFQFFPACDTLNNILTVGGSDSFDQKMADTNFGAVSVDVFAPGSDIYSTVLYSDDGNSANDYEYVSGTSMAAPQVAGLAALLLSQDPTLTALELKSIIMETATPIPALSGYCVTGARINAYDALWSVYHNHSYDDHYAWVNDMSHLAYCACGESVSQGHIVSGGLQPFAFGYSTCLLCGGRARMGFVN